MFTCIRNKNSFNTLSTALPDYIYDIITPNLCFKTYHPQIMNVDEKKKKRSRVKTTLPRKTSELDQHVTLLASLEKVSLKYERNLLSG